MKALLQQQNKLKLVSDWTAICSSNNYQQIVSFFNKHKTEMLSFQSPWFLQNVIQNDDVKTVRYILQQTDGQTYINLHCDADTGCPLELACSYSTLEMVKLIVSYGATFPQEIHSSGLIHDMFRWNNKMTGDEMYSCVDYLLSFLNGKIYHDRIIYSLLYRQLPFDRMKMANLIKSKRPNFMVNASNINYFGQLDVQYGRLHFEFADFLVDNGAKLDPVLFACTPSDAIIKWLLKHNVNINGNTENQHITPILRCCISCESQNKKKKIMEALLNNSADINKKCVYQNKEITALQYIKQTFPNKFFEYFKNYKPTPKPKSGNGRGIVCDGNESDEEQKELTPLESVENEFYFFLKRINMEKYFDKFKENECCDMDCFELFDDDVLQNDIGIQSKIARKKFLKHCGKMHHEIKNFKNNYGIPSVLYEKLAEYGIVTINILCKHVANKNDLKNKFKIKNNNQCNFMWSIVVKESNPMLTVEQNEDFEGPLNDHNQTAYL